MILITLVLETPVKFECRLLLKACTGGTIKWFNARMNICDFDLHFDYNIRKCVDVEVICAINITIHFDFIIWSLRKKKQQEDARVKHFFSYKRGLQSNLDYEVGASVQSRNVTFALLQWIL